jgi:hypothetical protein
MTKEEKQMVDDWKDKHMNRYCEGNSAWLSKKACLERQQVWNSRVRTTGVADGETMMNPRVHACQDCEYYETEPHPGSYHIDLEYRRMKTKRGADKSKAWNTMEYKRALAKAKKKEKK